MESTEDGAGLGMGGESFEFSLWYCISQVPDGMQIWYVQSTTKIQLWILEEC